jgi:hypothetical protein
MVNSCSCSNLLNYDILLRNFHVVLFAVILYSYTKSNVVLVRVSLNKIMDSKLRAGVETVIIGVMNHILLK